ncbi:MAG: ABC transporter ATP-binding protein, partial [Butyrivibrio sp.]|nr:ABC transporter ATP-binding protein [Butyrivibrio sp.]
MAEEKVREVKGPGQRGQRGAPRPKIKNPMKLFGRIMRYIFQYYSIQMILVVVCIIVSVLANVQGTLFTKTLIDQYIQPMIGQPDPSYGPLAGAMLKVACFYAIGVAAVFIQAKIMVYVNQGTLRRLREDLFTHMESLPIKYFDTHAHGDIMSVYTNDIDTLRQMISQSIPQLLNSGITIVSIVAMMLVLNIPLTVLTLAMVVLMFFVSGKATKASGKNFIAQQKNLGKLNGYIEEMMTGQKVVKVFCHEEESIKAFDAYNEDLFQSAFRANAFSGALGPINSQLGNLSYVLCAIVGGALALNQFAGFTVGALAS